MPSFVSTGEWKRALRALADGFLQATDPVALAAAVRLFLRSADSPAWLAIPAATNDIRAVATGCRAPCLGLLRDR